MVGKYTRRQMKYNNYALGLTFPYLISYTLTDRINLKKRISTKSISWYTNSGKQYENSKFISETWEKNYQGEQNNRFSQPLPKWEFVVAFSTVLRTSSLTYEEYCRVFPHLLRCMQVKSQWNRYREKFNLTAVRNNLKLQKESLMQQNQSLKQ